MSDISELITEIRALRAEVAQMEDKVFALRNELRRITAQIEHQGVLLTLPG